MNTAKLRILYIATFPPPIHGSSVVSMQIKNSKVINDIFDGDYINLGTSRNMNEIGKEGLLLHLQKLFRFIKSLWITFWYLLTRHYDLCYCAITINGVGFLKDSPFVLLCQLFRKKIVIHQHNKGMSRFVEKPFYNWLYRHVYKNVKVILLSGNLYDDISKVVDKKDVLVCPNGIPVIHKDKKSRFKESFEPLEMLFLSNLIESKGAWVVLDACKILKDKGYKFHCSFVGGVSKQIKSETFYLAVQERGIEDYVEYVGPKYGDEKEKYWQKADVFVFPTYYYNECFPLVILEAMQHKVAVVSSIEGGISDIVEDGITGFTVDNRVLRDNSCNEMLGNSATDREREQSRHFNVIRGQQTADALEKFFLNPALIHEFGHAGYDKYLSEFTEECFEERMLECLNKCL